MQSFSGKKKKVSKWEELKGGQCDWSLVSEGESEPRSESHADDKTWEEIQFVVIRQCFS